ncbi:hypothetical protein VZ95_14020, partial [Elstera litoralis]
ASLMGLILAGRSAPAVLAHPDVAPLHTLAATPPDWQTIVLLSSRDTDLPAAALWAKIDAVSSWPDWSRSAISLAEIKDSSDGGTIRFRINLLYGLMPFSYEAPRLAAAPRELRWGRAQPGAATLFSWRVTELDGGRSRVSLVAYLHGPAYGAARAILEGAGQRQIDVIVTHLLTAARP